MADCASSRSPSATTRGSVLRTRPLPKRLVSPPSPVRVATRALVRVVGTRDRIGARAVCSFVSGCFHRAGGPNAERSWRREGQEQEEEVQGGARARAQEKEPDRSGTADDLRGREAEAQRKGRLVAHVPT